jgi:monoamine oxidase
MPKLYARLRRRYRPEPSQGRRQFLLSTAAIGGGWLLSAGRSAAATASGRRVVVVGAGFGGLACAHELLSAGYDVTLVEARGRVGGRVLSFHDMIPGRTVEGGGELIGSNHPTWLAYADAFALDFYDVSEEEDLSMPIRLGDRLLDDRTAERIYEEMESAFDQLTGMCDGIDADAPWEADDAAQTDARTVADWIESLRVPPLVRRLIAVQLASDNAVPNDRASLLAMLTAVKGGGGDRYWSDSEAYRCVGGNDRLAHKLAESISAARIRLNCPVTEIRYRDDSATVLCSNGDRLECDRVVLATPPTTWPSIRFSPELPEPIAKMQMGTAVKYLTAVKSRYWAGQGKSQYAITDGQISQTWESTDGQGVGAGDTVGLTAFSGGPQAEACLGLAKEQTNARYASEFERIYPGFGEQFISARLMDWPRQRETMGGYSFPAPGQITAIGPMLRDGLGGLQFCGEHTCSRFAGYMEGGLYSGVSLARRMAMEDSLVAP